ncbi:hypothetical protein [Clostridium tarantellae]|uniref:hypothetical protein n=1 Tax=Clostridium tarantellae TaxID=39493 RepID=UPI001478B741|nr:hypothetical protein [Clostridium tarantellae]
MNKKKWNNPEASTLGVSLTEKGKEGTMCDHVQPGQPPQHPPFGPEECGKGNHLVPAS